jgi:hypothetical protein
MAKPKDRIMIREEANARNGRSMLVVVGLVLYYSVAFLSSRRGMIQFAIDDRGRLRVKSIVSSLSEVGAHNRIKNTEDRYTELVPSIATRRPQRVMIELPYVEQNDYKPSRIAPGSRIVNFNSTLDAL